MAKRTDLDNPFSKTAHQAAPVDNSDLDTPPTVSTGIGIRTGERQALDDIASELGVTRNALLRYAIRDFIMRYRAGQVDLSGQIDEPPPPKRKLRMP